MKLNTEAVVALLRNAKDEDGNELFAVVDVSSTDAGDVIVVKTEQEGIEAFVTVDDEEIRTVSYLCKLQDIPEERRYDMTVQMLLDNTPLVNFGLEEDGDEQDVVLRGSMSVCSREEVVVEEVSTVLAASERVGLQIAEALEAE